MKNSNVLVVISLLLITFSYSLLRGQDLDHEIGNFRKAVCPFSLPTGLVQGENFEFGYVTVPEFHNNPNGKTLELAVAIFPCSGENPAPDPLVMNTAGPGKSNMDNFIPQIAGGLGNYILPDRDIVIIELRGLRYSKPFLMCHEIADAERAMMGQNLSTPKTMAVLRKALKASKKRFNREGVDLSAFNNVETASDIALIMSKLGYEQFNIVGSSAGTLVAHHVIRDYPDRVRCAILDAGLPLDPELKINYVPSIVACLKNYFKECSLDHVCDSAYPHLEERFLKLIDDLNEDPVMLLIKDPLSGEKLDYALNGYRLSSYLFMRMFYSTQIPLLIGNVLDGDYRDVVNYLTNSLVPNYFADGLGFTVFISETGNYEVSDIDLDPTYQVFSEGVMRTGLGGRFWLEVDKKWKISKLDAKRIQYPEPSDVPVLVLNGKYDPVIPVKYDKVMKKNLKNCYIYRFDGVPHSAFDNATECALPMILQFLHDPSKAPDSRCMENYKQDYQVKDME
ncbi:MAG: alpha/beta hydrolase [Candidatus Marinimicrobia bacterium]|nr:alpha/beta hydrolase [Candidatus Neomarinimicrobiota bacterium]